MCAILDTNAAHEVFGSQGDEQATNAGKEFFRWLEDGKGKLVIGGKLSKELRKVPKFRQWAAEAKRTSRGNGKLMIIEDSRVHGKLQEIEQRDELQSDNPHIIALAQVSGARLLFSNDRNLHKDFKNPDIINNPRGKIYSTLKDENFKPEKKELLEQHRCKPRN